MYKISFKKYQNCPNKANFQAVFSLFMTYTWKFIVIFSSVFFKAVLSRNSVFFADFLVASMPYLIWSFNNVRSVKQLVNKQKSVRIGF